MYLIKTFEKNFSKNIENFFIYYKYNKKMNKQIIYNIIQILLFINRPQLFVSSSFFKIFFNNS